MKNYHSRVRVNRVSGNKQVRRELKKFLQALDSYPDRFAKNPKISFEQHLRSLAQSANSHTRRETAGTDAG
jgi:hypothetical protein